MRKIYIDNIRWITVVLVVIYHVIYMFNGKTNFGIIGAFYENQPQDVYQYIVYPWFMLLLFVVSGMSARFALEKMDGKSFLRARTRKLLVPSTIGLLVMGWILGYYNMLISGAFESGMDAVPKPILYFIMSISGCGPLWYIQMLWVFCLLLLLARKIEKDKLYQLCGKMNALVLIPFVVLVYGAAQILNTPIIVVYRFGIYGLGFFIGYFILSHENVMEQMGKWWILFTVLGIAAGAVFVVLYYGTSYAEHEVLDTICCNVYAWFGTLAVLAFMKKWGNFQNSFSKWMNKKAWGLYIFHYLCIAIVAWYLTHLSVPLSPLIIYLLVAIAAFAGSFLLEAVISRIPVLRWCILGIKKPKKEKAVTESV